MLPGGKLMLTPTPDAEPLIPIAAEQLSKHDSTATAALTWDVVRAPPSGAIDVPGLATFPSNGYRAGWSG